MARGMGLKRGARGESQGRRWGGRARSGRALNIPHAPHPPLQPPKPLTHGVFDHEGVVDGVDLPPPVDCGARAVVRSVGIQRQGGGTGSGRPCLPWRRPHPYQPLRQLGRQRVEAGAAGGARRGLGLGIGRLGASHARAVAGKLPAVVAAGQGAVLQAALGQRGQAVGAGIERGPPVAARVAPYNHVPAQQLRDGVGIMMGNAGWGTEGWEGHRPPTARGH